MNEVIIAPAIDGAETTKIPNDTSEVELGMWFWVKYKSDWDHDGRKKGEVYEELGCVTHIGSNYVQLGHPESPRGGSSSARVHFDNFWNHLRFEPAADEYIRSKAMYHQSEVRMLMGKVREVTARLGVTPTERIADHLSDAGQNAVAVVSSQTDVKAFKNELITAKEVTLPALFKDIETANNELARWMSAPTLPLKAQIGPLKGTIAKIDDSIFNVSLYAGLTEDATPVAEGEPADISEKLHIMQRRLYMDEECLLNYTGGGMKFAGIGEFDAWLAKPENRDRILPFPRTAVAFRVRRFERDYDGGLNIADFISFHMEKEADKATFLYIRNGEQVWRIQTDMDFGSKLFPDAGVRDDIELMVEKGGRKLMPRREWEVRKEKHDATEALWRAWNEENKDKGPDGQPIRNPYGFISNNHHFSHGQWETFGPGSVYYDDAKKDLDADVKAYNRVGLIIQGLFDRSPVLHPHMPVKTWTQEGFERALTLIYDGSGAALYAGEKPDFEAYRARINATIGEGSMVSGQEDIWLQAMAVKENERIRNGRGRETYYKRHRPYGNPGPGVVAQVVQWKRTRKATFRWNREASWRSQDAHKVSTFEVSAENLFNVSAYTPGDYKQFFADPRTREEYIKWAPLMLAAEDWHAGRRDWGRR